MTKQIKVRFSPERLDELEAQAVEDVRGAWYMRLSAPEVAVLVAAYRELDELREAAQEVIRIELGGPLLFDTDEHEAAIQDLHSVLEHLS